MKEPGFCYRFCESCDKRCCKKGPLLVMPKEKEAIVRLAGREDFFEGCGNYFILNGIPCPFLKNGKCEIHEIKPLDCKAYPIFIKPNSNSIEWRVDKDCPASKELSREFIEFAKKIFLKLPNELRDVDWKIACRAGFRTKKLSY